MMVQKSLFFFSRALFEFLDIRPLNEESRTLKVIRLLNLRENINIVSAFVQFWNVYIGKLAFHSIILLSSLVLFGLCYSISFDC